MKRIRPDLDIVKDVLEAVLKVRPDSAFVHSLMHQYTERGGLSKRQLQGLHDKAMKIPGIPPAKMATLEAIILQKQLKSRSPLPANTPFYTVDDAAAVLVKEILAKYPQHKRILFLKSKLDNQEVLTASEKTELEKFAKLLLK